MHNITLNKRCGFFVTLPFAVVFIALGAFVSIGAFGFAPVCVLRGAELQISTLTAKQAIDFQLSHWDEASGVSTATPEEDLSHRSGREDLGLAEIVTLKIELEGKGFDENDPEFVTWVVLGGASVELFRVDTGKESKTSVGAANSNNEQNKEDRFEEQYNRGETVAYGKEIKMRVLVKNSILDGEMVTIRVFTKNFDYGEISFNLYKPGSWMGQFRSPGSEARPNWSMPNHDIKLLSNPSNVNFEGLVWREVNLGEEAFPLQYSPLAPFHKTGDSYPPSEGLKAFDYSAGWWKMVDQAGGCPIGIRRKIDGFWREYWPTEGEAEAILKEYKRLEIRWNCGFEFYEGPESGNSADYSLKRYGGRMTPTWQIWTYTCDDAYENFKMTISKFGTIYTKIVINLFYKGENADDKPKFISEDWFDLKNFTVEPNPGEYLSSDEDKIITF